MRLTRYCTAWVLALPLAIATSADGRQSALTIGEKLQGQIEISTSATGRSAYVTVTDADGWVGAAFTVQYQNRMPAIAYQGTGSVTVTASSLTVDSADQALLFKFPSYGGRVRAGQRAVDVAGIAAYSWRDTQARPAPISHAHFVATYGLSRDDDPPVCNYSECVCGGAGSQSCGCGGVQVSCYAPYEACCTSSRAFCCQPKIDK